MRTSYARKENDSIREEVSYDTLKTYLSDISKHTVLEKEEEIKIAEKAHRHKDIASSQKLVLSNLRLVVKIALEYYNAYLNVLDLIQEGNVGLVQAVKKYNPYKGTRFSTYASFWIRAYIKKHIMDSRSMIKIGTTQAQRRLFYGLNREKRRLEAMGATPDPDVIAERLRVRAKDVEDMDQRLARSDVSLEQHIYDEGQETFIGLLTTEDDIEEEVAEKEKQKIVGEKISEFKQTLNPKARYILERRIMADEPETLTEIGVKFNISRERVRQIEGKILKKFSKAFEEEFQNFCFLPEKCINRTVHPITKGDGM